MNFSGALDRKLYRRALRLHGTPPPWLGITLLLAGVWGLVSSPADAGWGMPLFIGVLGAVLLLLPFISVRQAFRTNAVLRNEFRGHADASGFAAESPNGTVNIPWSLFYRAVVAADMVLLYVSAQQFHILARHFFASDAEWIELQSLVRANVKLKRTRASAIKVVLLWLAIVIGVFILWSLSSAPNSPS